MFFFQLFSGTKKKIAEAGQRPVELVSTMDSRTPKFASSLCWAHSIALQNDCKLLLYQRPCGAFGAFPTSFENRSGVVLWVWYAHLSSLE